MRLLLALLALALPAPLLAMQAQQANFEFGDDSSQFSNDGECDDMRFTGPGMTETPLLVQDIATDATDCRAAFDDGRLEFDPLFANPAHPRDIVWGDDASTLALDGRCGDARFTGYYAADMNFERADVGHDATDCRALFVKGIARWAARGS